MIAWFHSSVRFHKSMIGRKRTMLIRNSSAVFTKCDDNGIFTGRVFTATGENNSFSSNFHFMDKPLFFEGIYNSVECCQIHSSIWSLCEFFLELFEGNVRMLWDDFDKSPSWLCDAGSRHKTKNILYNYLVQETPPLYGFLHFMQIFALIICFWWLFQKRNKLIFDSKSLFFELIESEVFHIVSWDIWLGSPDFEGNSLIFSQEFCEVWIWFFEFKNSILKLWMPREKRVYIVLHRKKV